MNASAHDVVTPRGSRSQMLDAARILDPLGLMRTPRQLSPDEVAGLEENARRVAEKYWLTKGRRSLESVQNQLNLGRWHYIDQAPYAKMVLLEIVSDTGLSRQYFP